MSRRYLFVCGCARSGTSALVELLTSDPRIALGTERYAHLYMDRDLTPDLFTKERFSSIREGDTFYDDLLEADEEYYSPILRKFDDAIYVGDKIPQLYKRFDRLAVSLPGAKVVMIIRNIYDVAASFEARADDPEDELWSRNVRTGAAIQRWSESLRALQDPPADLEIFPVVYEEFFLAGRGLEQIYAFLELGRPDSQILRKYGEFCYWGRRLESTGERRRLSSLAAFRISQTAEFGLYRKFTAGRFTIGEETGRKAPVGAGPDLDKLRELCRARRFEEAAQLLTGVDLSAEWPPVLLYFAGACLGAVGDERRALDLLKRSAAAGFSYFGCAFYLGLYEATGGDLGNAAYYFTIVLLRDPARSGILQRLKRMAPRIRPELLAAIQGGQGVPVQQLREQGAAEAAQGNKPAAVYYLAMALWLRPPGRGNPR